MKGIFTRFLARIFFVFVVYFDYEDFYQEKNIGFLSAIGYFFILNFFNVKEFFYSFSEDIKTKLWKVNSNCELIENQKIISLIAENEELKGENTFLRESLGLKNYPEISLISGRIISKDYISDSILINTGSKDGVKVGFPVAINNNILIGRVLKFTITIPE